EPNPNLDPIEIDDPEIYKGDATVSTLTKEQAAKILNNKYMVLVNRSHRLPSDYNGIDLISRGDHRLNKTAYSALDQLMDAGKEAGYSYVLYSGYRTYSHQYNNYYNKINYYKNNGYSEEDAIRLTDQYHAPPGASEHHTGLAADVCIPSIVNKYACLHENYEYTDEYKWFSANAHKYGFILRYRKGDEAITGYNFEPWHYRFVGVDIATEIYKRDITLEEYIEELEEVAKQS
ncbi:MAG: M15 family metallopeptidase, partial [Clostridia bacterium]|nr:M15 family metallopeptidase [Clostridia bacterium]